MFRIVICLNNKERRSIISTYIEKTFSARGVLYSIISFNNSRQLIRHGLKKLQPDILLFDPSENDDQMNQTLLSLKHIHPHLIFFITSSSYNISSYGTDNILYFHQISIDNFNDFRYKLYSAYEENLKDRDNFRYFYRREYFSHPINQIQYFSSEARRIHLISDTNTDISFYKKLDSVESQLSFKNCTFVRVHKSYLVNINYVSSYNRNILTMKNGVQIGISTSKYYKNLRLHI